MKIISVFKECENQSYHGAPKMQLFMRIRFLRSRETKNNFSMTHGMSSCELKYGWTHLVPMVRGRKTCLVSRRLKCLENWKRHCERSRRIAQWTMGAFSVDAKDAGRLAGSRNTEGQWGSLRSEFSEHFSLSFIFRTFIRPYARFFFPASIPISLPDLPWPFSLIL